MCAIGSSPCISRGWRGILSWWCLEKFFTSMSRFVCWVRNEDLGVVFPMSVDAPDKENALMVIRSHTDSVNKRYGRKRYGITGWVEYEKD